MELFLVLWYKNVILTVLICFDSEERTQKESQELRKRAVKSN